MADMAFFSPAAADRRGFEGWRKQSGSTGLKLR